jgi:hypothetical protein
MKPNQRVKTPKKDLLSQDIPAVYDITNELQIAKQCRLKARSAIAWVNGGRVMISLDGKFDITRDLRKTHEDIYRRWLNETGLFLEPPLEEKSPTVSKSLVGYVRCVACSNGGRWVPWKELDILEFLLCPPGSPPSRSVYEVPIEFTIFDPDKNGGVWIIEHEGDIHSRFLEHGHSLLREIARVYCLAVELIEDFEETFELVHEYPKNPQAIEPADLLRDCKKAVIELIVSVILFDHQKTKRIPDGVMALAQGFLIGTRLARAEGIISTARDMKLVLQQGVSGQHTSAFWNWLIELQETSLKGKTAEELFTWLDGKPDPWSKGFKLQIVEDNKLKRGNGDLITLSAFKSGLSRAKTRIRNMSRKTKN